VQYAHRDSDGAYGPDAAQYLRGYVCLASQESAHCDVADSPSLPPVEVRRQDRFVVKEYRRRADTKHEPHGIGKA
jgi:hypothetical protein